MMEIKEEKCLAERKEDVMKKEDGIEGKSELGRKM